jgi:DNA-binding response OmpR family regulator
MKRVMLMDDSEMFLAGLTSALQAAGYDVTSANDLAQLADASASSSVTSISS